jgi:hypothetical protein
MQTITTVGFDIAKAVFQVHGGAGPTSGPPQSGGTIYCRPRKIDLSY